MSVFGGLNSIQAVASSNGQNYVPVLSNFTVVNYTTWTVDITIVNGVLLTVSLEEGAAKDRAGWLNLPNAGTNRTVDTGMFLCT